MIGHESGRQETEEYEIISVALGYCLRAPVTFIYYIGSPVLGDHNTGIPVLLTILV